MLDVFFKMDLGVPSALKRAMAILGMAALARALAASSVPPAGSESDLYRRRPDTRAIPPAANEHAASSSRDLDPDDVITDDLVKEQPRGRHNTDG